METERNGVLGLDTGCSCCGGCIWVPLDEWKYTGEVVKVVYRSEKGLEKRIWEFGWRFMMVFLEGNSNDSCIYDWNMVQDEIDEIALRLSPTN